MLTGTSVAHSGPQQEAEIHLLAGRHADKRALLPPHAAYCYL